MTPRDYDGRIARLRQWMREAVIDAALITTRRDIRYLSGFSGSAGLLLITLEGALLLSDGRYRTQAAEQSRLPFAEYERGNRHLVLLDALQGCGAQVLGYQDGAMTARELHTLEDVLPDMAFEPMGDILLELRSVKSAEEIELLAKAARMTDAAYAQALSAVREGATERQIALALEIALREGGADALSFPIIVASGDRAALPHAEPGERKLQRGDFVIMDFGGVYDGYHTDMTRTVAIGEPDDSARELYAMVLKAQLAGLASVRSDVIAASVDKAARDIIAHAGYGESFMHSLGHGVGLSVHELPTIAASSETVLQEGMIVTVEPGIYLPGRLGIRIEDLCVVEARGVRRLSETPKDLMIIS